MHDAGIGKVADAYQTWSGVVSGVSLVGMAAVSSKYPIYRKMVCDNRPNTMRKPCSQYPAHIMVNMTHMTARAPKRRTGGNVYVSGKLCGAYAWTDLHVAFPPCVSIRENRERQDTLFCVSVFVLLVCELPLTEPPPEASSSVARECMRPEARA